MAISIASMLALSPLGMASAHETTVSVADDAAATTVEPRYGEKTTMTLISTAKTGVTGYCLQPPSAAHYYQARITKNYTIKHYRVDYYEYGVKKRTFIRTCMSRYLKLHILSASHKFAYRRESS